MSSSAQNVRVGRTGAVYVAPVGSTGPTSSQSSLDAAYVDLGFVSTDGVEVAPNETSNQIFAWQNSTLVRTVFTEAYETIHLTLIESKGAVVELFYRGDTVAVVSAGEWKIDVHPGQSDPRAYVIDVIDGSKFYRYDIPNGEITERGSIVYSNGGDPIGFEITISAYGDSNGKAYTIFTNDTNWGYS